MLEDFIKKAEKAQRTIEIIEKEEWEYIKEWFYESIQDEAPTVIENLAKRLLGKANESGQIDKWNEAAEFVYQLAMKKGDRRTHDTFEVEQFITNVKYVKENIGDLDIPNPFNNIENKGFFFTGFELLLLFIANLKLYSKIRERAEKKERISDLKYIINNIIALNELGAISNKYVTDVIALDKLKPILDRFIDDETRNELDEKLNGYAQENLIALDKAEEIRKEYYDKKKALIKSKKKEGKFSEEEYQKELKDLEKEGKKSKKELYENRCKEMVDIIRDIVEILNAKGLTNLNLTQNYTTNFPRLLKERNVIYSKYKTGELPTHDNRHIIALGIEDLRQLYGKSLYLGTIQNRLYYINEHYDEYCWRKPNTWVKLHFYS